MKLDDVGEIIATRSLSMLHDDRTSSEVLVVLGKPQPLPGLETDYYCPYQIRGAGSEKVRHTCGIDAFQAIKLAIRSLGVHLDLLNKELGGRLRWDGDKDGQLGFLLPE